MKHNNLITNQCLHHRNLHDPGCSDCQGIVEIVLHVMQNCDAAKSAWIPQVSLEHWEQFFNIACFAGLIKTCRKNLRRGGKGKWQAS